MPRRRARMFFAALATLAVTAVAACSPEGAPRPTEYPLPPEGPHDYSQRSLYDEAVRQFEYARDSIELPDGKELVMFDRPTAIDDTGNEYDVGLTPYEGWARAETGAVCLWIAEWLENRTSNPDAAMKAAEHIADFRDTWTFAYDSDPESTQPHYMQIAETVALGDPTYAERHFTLNCAASYSDQYRR